ncbi:MAG: hypothetical protein QM773_01245 [Hyphomonadaceae bacterium]
MGDLDDFEINLSRFQRMDEFTRACLDAAGRGPDMAFVSYEKRALHLKSVAVTGKGKCRGG